MKFSDGFLQIVDQTSAVLGIANERIIPVNRDHSDICKYSGVGDEVYKLVLSQLQRFVQEAVTLPETSETRSLARSSNSQNAAQPEPQSDRTCKHVMLIVRCFSLD